MAETTNITTYNFQDTLSGDTCRKVRFTITVNTVAKDLTGTAIACQFRYGKKSGNIVKDFSIGSGITIIDATAGVFELDAFIINGKIGTYYYDIQFTDGTIVSTYVSGTLVITQDVTK